MSIATLKRKTQVKYNNLSVGRPHFSINGTLRNQGYVGQTSLSRSLPRTLFNGIYPRGHGGCCGTFKIGQTVQSGILPLNDPNVIKPSVISSKGMIEEELNCLNSLRVQRWNKKLPQRSVTMNVVKPDNNQHQVDQGNYIENKAKKAIQCAPDNIFKKGGTCGNADPYFSRVHQTICGYTKPPSYLSAISQGERIRLLNNRCAVENMMVTTNTRKTPFACGL